jgi:MEMO1 family protein
MQLFSPRSERENKLMSMYRKSAVSGYFYPSDKQELLDNINSLLAKSKEFKKENIFGIISPHAGYVFSGQTAAYSYNALKDQKVKTVIIISPSHRKFFRGISIYNGEGYETPLGKVKINHSMAEAIINGSKHIFYGREGHDLEHAVEVQIPFLQAVLEDFEIIPAVMGDQTMNLIDELSEKIAIAADDSTLIIASSDLSHFHSKKEAEILDSIAADRIACLDYEGLIEDIENQKCEACGGGPIAVLLKAAYLLGKKSCMILHRSDSSDVSGDENEVVGYLSAVVY